MSTEWDPTTGDTAKKVNISEDSIHYPLPTLCLPDLLLPPPPPNTGLVHNCHDHFWVRAVDNFIVNGGTHPNMKTLNPRRMGLTWQVQGPLVILISTLGMLSSSSKSCRRRCHVGRKLRSSCSSSSSIRRRRRPMHAIPRLLSQSSSSERRTICCAHARPHLMAPH